MFHLSQSGRDEEGLRYMPGNTSGERSFGHKYYMGVVADGVAGGDGGVEFRMKNYTICWYGFKWKSGSTASTILPT